jgi:hypothetical protein
MVPADTGRSRSRERRHAHQRVGTDEMRILVEEQVEEGR